MEKRIIFYAVILMAVAVGLLAYSPASTAYEFQCIDVRNSVCITCHPGASPGKCNLVVQHPEAAGCAACHNPCSDNEPPATFDHLNDCLVCHPVGASDGSVPGTLHGTHEATGTVHCGDCHTQKRVLIAYDGKRGTTKGYANIVAEKLCEAGYRVELDSCKNLLNTNLSRYDGVIVGSPVIWGTPLPEIRHFIESKRSQLAGKPVAYMYNALYGAQDGNSWAKGFYIFHHRAYLYQFPDIWDLTPWICSDPDPLKSYPYCNSVPFWVGLMPGQQIINDWFPVEYIHMELAGQGGNKLYYRPAAATEWAQSLINSKFFEGIKTNPPTVTASATPTSGVEALTVNFTANGSDSDGTIVSYNWTFGDAAKSSEQNPVHTYQCDGTYTAIVEVTDDAGATALKSLTITVTSAGGSPSYTCDVAPLMAKHCNDCHGNSGGLNVRTCAGLAAGGNSGPVLIPGDSTNSLLIQKITHPYTHWYGAYIIPQSGVDTIAAWVDSLDPTCLPEELCSCSLAP